MGGRDQTPVARTYPDGDGGVTTIPGMSATDLIRWPISRLGHVAGSAVRALREDLFTFSDQPLPPLGGVRRPLFRWFPHLAVALYAAILLIVGADDYRTGDTSPRELPVMAAFALAAAQATPLVLALFRPMAAWWMSWVAMVGGALMTFPSTTEAMTHWPWTPTSLLAHLGVMVLVGLRVRVRAVVEIWVLTVGVGAVLVVIQQGGDVFGNEGLPLMTIVSTTALIIAVAVRERSVALKQLAEQSMLTSAERSRRALLEERARIARELHDVVAHHMSVIAIQAEAAPFRVSEAPAELTSSLETIRKNAVDALAELRRILGVLRAEDVDGGGADVVPQPMLDRLDELLENVRAAGMEVEVTVTGAPRELPPGVELSAFRIVQEALSNALKHAPGATVRVEISHVLSGVGIRVVNERSARAFASTSTGSGHGLLGMRERAAMLGGELSAGPTSGGGYEVSAFLPLAGGKEPS